MGNTKVQNLGSYQLRISTQQPESDRTAKGPTVAVAGGRLVQDVGCGSESDPNASGSSNERERADVATGREQRKYSSKKTNGP